MRTTLNSSAEGNRSSQRRNNRCSTLKIDSVPQLLNNSDIWERNTAVVSEEFGVLNVGVTHSGDNVCWENHEDFSYKAPSFLLPPSNTHLPIRLTKKIPLWVSSRQFHSGINNRLMRRAKATTVEPNVFIEPNSKDLLMECLITEKEITDSLTLLKIPHDAKG